MAANTRLAVAVHILTGLAYRRNDLVSSEQMARSVNTNPAFVRRILAKLTKAGIVHSTAGKTGGARLAVPPARINLLDVYRALGEDPLFALHHNAPLPTCAVSCGIRDALAPALQNAQSAAEKALARVTIQQLLVQIPPGD